MKANTHPTYFENLNIVCACGNIVVAGSTKKDLKTELCSACHPFYTGKQKLIDTAGRVDKYLEKVKKMQAIKEKKVKVVEDENDMTLSSGDEEPKKAKKPAAKKAAKAKKEESTEAAAE